MGRTMRYSTKKHPTLGVFIRNDGAILRKRHGKVRAYWFYGSNNGTGYMQARINGKSYCIHRLVYETFIGDIPSGMQVDHIDRNSLNNTPGNLRACTPSQNSRNTIRNARSFERYGVSRLSDLKTYSRVQKRQWRNSNREHYNEYMRTYRSNHKEVA